VSGTSVTINDTAPTTDRYNLSVVEILAASGNSGSTFAISGTVSPSGSGTFLSLSENGTTTATATGDASGNYSFTGLANGTYVVTPSKSGSSFTPASQSVPVNGG
jgi:hypothetical protein